MDRNQIIGMVLMLILMTVYFQFFSPDLPEPVIGKTTIEQSIENKNNANQAVGQSNNATLNQSTDSLLTAMNNEKYGVFAAFAEGAEETFNIENDDIVATFSTKGGQIKKLVLKGHLTFEKKPLVLIDEQSSALDIWIKSNYKPINLSDLNFSTGRTGTKVTGTDTLNFSFKISLDGNRFVEQQYTIPGAGHVIGYKLKMSGLDGIVDNEDVLINWINKMKVYEDNLTASRAETTINYYTALEGMDDLSATSNDKESEEIVTQVNWLAFHQKFFTSAIIAENNFRSVAISIEFDELDSTVVKILLWPQ
jgi:YidC/Oxa1 family membrane protein insertase